RRWRRRCRLGNGYIRRTAPIQIEINSLRNFGLASAAGAGCDGDQAAATGRVDVPSAGGGRHEMRRAAITRLPEELPPGLRVERRQGAVAGVDDPQRAERENRASGGVA